MLQRGLSLLSVVGCAAGIMVCSAAVMVAKRPSSLHQGRGGCASNMRTIYQAAALYAIDNGRGEETPETQGFAYTYGWGWIDTLDQYGDVYPALHCPSESENLKEFRTTYGFHLRHNMLEDNEPADDDLRARRYRATDKRMMTLSAKLGPAMPIVSCQVHDELEAFYSDPEDRRRKMDPVMNWIGADGAIRFERAPWILRSPMSQVKMGDAQP